ncbi:MAG TPA: hypothetical protein VFM96_10180 [Gaiellaceae bacterium]|nr:hypothetical protein [Gaiellaceae bacterium]
MDEGLHDIIMRHVKRVRDLDDSDNLRLRVLAYIEAVRNLDPIARDNADRERWDAAWIEAQTLAEHLKAAAHDLGVEDGARLAQLVRERLRAP